MNGNGRELAPWVFAAPDGANVRPTEIFIIWGRERSRARPSDPNRLDDAFESISLVAVGQFPFSK